MIWSVCRPALLRILTSAIESITTSNNKKAIVDPRRPIPSTQRLLQAPRVPPRRMLTLLQLLLTRK